VEPFELPSDDVTIRGERWTAPQQLGTVILLHGGGQTRRSWRLTAGRLQSAGWTAVTYDLRGHGDSDWSAGVKYSTDDMVGDLRRLMSWLDPAEPPVLVGASLGGLTSLVLEGEVGLAKALVLVDVAVHLDPAGVERIMAFMARHRAGFATLEEAGLSIAAYRKSPRIPSTEGLHHNLRRHADGRWHWHWDPAFLGDPPIRRTDEARVARAARQVQVPVLLVRGRTSDVVTDGVVDDLVQLVPQAEVLAANAGHMVVGDDNDAFTDGLQRFLERVA
jgi:pimeloyl-ACP methyl ester carboxylesterase